MTAICPIPLDICALRVTRLTDLGAVAAGPNNSYVTDKITQLPVTPVIETGDDLTKKGGCSCIVATAKLPDMLKRFDFSLAKDALEPGLEEIDARLDDHHVGRGPDRCLVCAAGRLRQGSAAEGRARGVVEELG